MAAPAACSASGLRIARSSTAMSQRVHNHGVVATTASCCHYSVVVGIENNMAAAPRRAGGLTSPRRRMRDHVAPGHITRPGSRDTSREAISNQPIATPQAVDYLLSRPYSDQPQRPWGPVTGGSPAGGSGWGSNPRTSEMFGLPMVLATGKKRATARPTKPSTTPTSPIQPHGPCGGMGGIFGPLPQKSSKASAAADDPPDTPTEQASAKSRRYPPTRPYTPRTMANT